MNEPAPDRPDVLVFPPVILIATIALGFLLQWLVPFGVLASFDRTSRYIAGGILCLVGLIVSALGARTLVGRGTNVNPAKPALALAINGIYRWTRNPMYVGGAPLMIGLAVAFALDWLIVLLVPSFILLHFGVVRREERYLERKFGEDYRRYLARVPRYVWPF